MAGVNYIHHRFGISDEKKILYYIAAPYSSQDRSVRNYRLDMIGKLCRVLVAGGIHLYSPVTHSVHISDEMDSGDHLMGWSPGWKEFDEHFMNLCDRLIVYCLPGWQRSTGVTEEIKIMNQEQKKPVFYIFEEGLESYPKNRDVKFFIHEEGASKEEILIALETGLRAKPYYPWGEPAEPTIYVPSPKQSDLVTIETILENILRLVVEGPEISSVSPQAQILSAVEREALKAIKLLKEKGMS